MYYSCTSSVKLLFRFLSLRCLRLSINFTICLLNTIPDIAMIALKTTTIADWPIFPFPIDAPARTEGSEEGILAIEEIIINFHKGILQDGAP